MAASQKCDHCGATVPADEQFCPNCGSFIDPLSPVTTAGRDNIITVNSDGNYEEFELGAPPPPADPAEGGQRQTKAGKQVKSINCPSCGAVNPPNNRHCQECGARLSQGPLPTAPRPTVQATAGVRAALAISALLFGVVVIALLFNAFNGGGGTATESTTTIATSTSTSLAELGPIDVIDTQCSVDGIGSFICENVTSGTDAEYQVTWEDLDPQEITIRLTFNQPMAIQRVDWYNLADDTQFQRNYRARGLLIEAQDSLQQTPIELTNDPGLQSIPYAAINANWVEFTITSAYQAQVVDDNVFRELAIQEITVIGRPATTTTTAAP
ncbi:MAG: zinc-ribbon domain-containing protein [Acidimicrobiia bacterium]